MTDTRVRGDRGRWSTLRIWGLALGFTGSLLAVGCGGPDQERVPLGEGQATTQQAVEDLPEAIQERLNLANTAYRERNYETALRHFTRITEEAPGLAAGWYGVGMTYAAMGDQAAADSAMMQVHRLAPEMPLQHPGAGAPPNPHPSPPSGTDEGQDGYGGVPGY
jgi:tetratricopeptide (TPR) repeat protein